MNIYSSEIAHTLFISFVVDTFELKAIHEQVNSDMVVFIFAHIVKHLAWF